MPVVEKDGEKEAVSNQPDWGLLTRDHHVEDRVQTRRPGQGGAELPLADDDRARVSLTVENARNEAFLAEAADTARADLVGFPLGHLQRDAIARHRRTIVAEPRR